MKSKPLVVCMVVIVFMVSACTKEVIIKHPFPNDRKHELIQHQIDLGYPAAAYGKPKDSIKPLKITGFVSDDMVSGVYSDGVEDEILIKDIEEAWSQSTQYVDTGRDYWCDFICWPVLFIVTSVATQSIFTGIVIATGVDIGLMYISAPEDDDGVYLSE